MWILSILYNFLTTQASCLHFYSKVSEPWGLTYGVMSSVKLYKSRKKVVPSFSLSYCLINVILCRIPNLQRPSFKWTTTMGIIRRPWSEWFIILHPFINRCVTYSFLSSYISWCFDLLQLLCTAMIAICVWECLYTLFEFLCFLSTG